MFNYSDSKKPQPYHDPVRSVRNSPTEITTAAPGVSDDVIRVIAAQMQRHLSCVADYDFMAASVRTIQDAISPYPEFANQQALCELHMRFMLGMRHLSRLRDARDPDFEHLVENRQMGGCEYLSMPSFNYIRACLLSPVVWLLTVSQYRLDTANLVALTQSLSAPYAH